MAISGLKMGKSGLKNGAALAVLVLAGLTVDMGRGAQAAQFDLGEGYSASWVTQLTASAGLRTEDPGCNQVGDPAVAGCGGSANTAQWANGDIGDMNYRKGQLYSTMLKATSEVLLKAPDNYKFMARGTGFYDFAADHTAYSDLPDDARNHAVHNVKLLDLWGSKDYDLDGHHGHVRVGNQVLNWGEAIYAPGGISNSNAMDLQKLVTPGTQLKEAVLPAPMVSVAQSLTSNTDLEAYYQFGWNSDRFPTVGTFFSTSNNLGAGYKPIFLNPNNFNVAGIGANVVPVNFDADQKPDQQGEYGVKLHYKPSGTQVDLGFYAENYHDKMPVLLDNPDGNLSWKYLENRQLYGFSTNFPAGPWSIGTETSYRPKDAVSLTGCYSDPSLDANTSGVSGVSCRQWKDMQKWQNDIAAMLAMTPSDEPTIMNSLRADTATLTVEGTWVYYPGVSSDKIFSRTINGQTVYQGVSSGYYSWLSNSSNGYQVTGTKGTANSGGATIDFNWVYDGTVISGWQVNPGVTFFYGIYGYTPNFAAPYEQGAKSLNFYVYFNKNPAVWQAGMNFTHYFGGNTITQPLTDRDNIGVFVTRNF